MPSELSKRPLISVVIPAYNRAVTIAGCLQSVQRQTYSNWEAIVVDDGSKDRTVSVIKDISRDDNRIRLVRHDRNRGAQAARNSGIHNARGEWIAFLDSDDQFLPESLESRLALAYREKVSVVHSSCNMIDEDGRITPYRVEAIVGQVYRRLLENEGPVFPALLATKESLKRINYLDERIIAFQEWDTTLRLAKFYEFGYEPRPTFVWDCRGSDTISKQMARAGKGYEQVIHKHWLPILRYLGSRALAQHYRNAASWYERGGDRRAARRCQVMAFIWFYLDPRRATQRLLRILNLRRA